jgi:hypothetical protein
MVEKIKKLAAVAFLTLLIWAWAYLALEQTIIESGTLNISPAISKGILVSFDREPPVRLKLGIKGSASAITEFRRRLLADDNDQDKERLEFLYNPEIEGKAESEKDNKLDVLGFLKKNTRLKRLGLTVESCDVEAILVTIEKLEERWLPVQCLDESGTVLAHSTVEPARVKMFVRQDWGPEMSKARVTLTPVQIEQARKAPVLETPYVELAIGQRKYTDIKVKIKLPSATEILQDRILQPTIGFVLSKNLKDKFNIELLNENNLTSATKIKASDEAWLAYDKRTPYQIIVEARDGDENIGGEISRKVIYNFPREYVQKQEIKLNEPPREARFRLTPASAQMAQP